MKGSPKPILFAFLALALPLLILVAFTSAQAAQDVRPPNAVDPDLRVYIAPDKSSIELENSQLRVVYGAFIENEKEQFAIKEFTHKSNGINQAGYYLDADEKRSTLKDAVIVDDGSTKKTVRLTWYTVPDSKELIHEVIQEVSLYPNQAFLKIDYVDVDYGVTAVDNGKPGGTEKGEHFAYGSSAWAALDLNSGWPLEYGGFVTREYTPTVGAYYNRHVEDAVGHPSNGGSLAYHGHFIIGVANPSGINKGIGYARVMPVAESPVVRLLQSIDRRNGLEFLHLGTPDPFTGFIFPFTGGESEMISVGMSLADGNYGVFSASTFQSDDFNTCGGLNTDLWTFEDPIADGSYSLANNQVSISVPAGVDHDIWGTGPGFLNEAPRLMQPAADEDMGIEAKFESQLSQRFQMQGILIKQDEDDWMRFEFHHDGANVRVTAVKILAGVATNLGYENITTDGSVPLYMRVSRVGDLWTQSYSLDGVNYIEHIKESVPMTVSDVGFYAGNTSDNPGEQPAFTAVIDYFFNMEAPISPEDAVSNTVSAVASPAVGGSVTVSPSQPTYTCGEQVTLTALPADGFQFDHWEGAATGTDNPVTVTADGAKSVTAVFTPVAPDTFTLTVNVSGSGNVTKNPEKALYNENEEVTLTAVPEPGWQFAGWQGPVTGSTNPLTLTITANTTINAIFQEEPEPGTIYHIYAPVVVK